MYGIITIGSVDKLLLVIRMQLNGIISIFTQTLYYCNL